LILSEAAKALGMERTTLTRNLRHLDKAGLTQTLVDGHDARVRRLALTTKGWARLEAALPSWRLVQKQTLAELESGSWPTLRTNLDFLGHAAALIG